MFSNSKRFFSFALCLLGGFLSEHSATAQSYTITDLGVIPGENYSFASKLNNLGQVAGSSGGPQPEHAALFSGGAVQDLGTLGGPYSFGFGINDRGEVVGVSDTNDRVTTPHAFVYSGGSLHDLGGISTEANGINSKGQIVGEGHVPAPNALPYHAFLWNPTTPNGTVFTRTDLGTLGGPESHSSRISETGMITGSAELNRTIPNGAFVHHAFLSDGGALKDLGTLPGDDFSEGYAINSAGQVVGRSSDNTGNGHAFFYNGTTMIDLGTLPGDLFSSAFGINDSGQIVGWSYDDAANPVGHAFLYNGGTSINLLDHVINNIGWTFKYATDINDVGQISGVGTYPDGEFHGFLLTPTTTPEPSETALFTSLSITGSLFMLGHLRRCRRSGN